MKVLWYEKPESCKQTNKTKTNKTTKKYENKMKIGGYAKK